MTSERLDIIVTDKGTRVVKRNIDDIGRSATGAAGATNFLKNALKGLGGALAIRQLQQYADTYTNIQNRLKNVTDSTAQLANVTESLFDISKRTRSSYESTAELYARVGLAAKDLGTSQEELLNFTESLNQAVILSGATAQESAAGIIQLSQGLASGALRGDELRSVLEQLPAVADIIAKSLGVTRGELRQMGTEGKITADVVLKSFRDAREELAERFGKTVPTIGQSFVVLKNEVIKTIGEFDKAQGITEKLSGLILGLADNFDTFARVVGAAAIVLGVGFAQRAVGAAIAGIRSLTIAIAANPLGAIAVAITTVVALLITFSDVISLGGDNLATFGDFAMAVWENIKIAVGTFISFFNENFGFIGDLASQVFGDVNFSILGVLEIGAKTIDFIVGYWVGGYRAIVAAFSGLPDAFKSIFTSALNGAITLVESGVNKIIGSLNTITDFVGADGIELIKLSKIENEASNLGATVKDAFLSGFDNTAVQDALSNTVKQANQIAKDRIDAEEKKKKDLANAGGGGGTNNTLSGGAKDLLKDIRGPQEDFAQGQRDLTELLNAGKISVEEYGTALDDLRIKFLDTQTDLGSGVERAFAKISTDLGDAASQIEGVITGAFQKSEDALVDFVKTGKGDFKGLVDSILTDLIRLTVKQGILKPIAGAFGDVIGGLGGEGGGGFLDSFTKSLSSSGGGDAAGGFFSSLMSGLTGFATGGEFTVPGANGIDNQLVAFRGTPGEKVSVTRPGDDGSGGAGQNIVFNISTPDVQGFKNSESQVAARVARITNKGRRNL